MPAREEQPERVRIRFRDGAEGACSREQALRCGFRILEADEEPEVKAVQPAPPASPAEIRAWAQENNVPCPKKGRIPASVVEAYQAR